MQPHAGTIAQDLPNREALSAQNCNKEPNVGALLCRSRGNTQGPHGTCYSLAHLCAPLTLNELYLTPLVLILVTVCPRHSTAMVSKSGALRPSWWGLSLSWDSRWRISCLRECYPMAQQTYQLQSVDVDSYRKYQGCYNSTFDLTIYRG